MPFLEVDVIIDKSIDVAMTFLPIFFETDEKKKSDGKGKFFADELPKHLKNLEVLSQLYGEGGLFFVGDHLTWADLKIYDLFDFLLRIDANFLSSHPNLQKHREHVAN